MAVLLPAEVSPARRNQVGAAGWGEGGESPALPAAQPPARPPPHCPLPPSRLLRHVTSGQRGSDRAGEGACLWRGLRRRPLSVSAPLGSGSPDPSSVLSWPRETTRRGLCGVPCLRPHASAPAARAVPLHRHRVQLPGLKGTRVGHVRAEGTRTEAVQGGQRVSAREGWAWKGRDRMGGGGGGDRSGPSRGRGGGLQVCAEPGACEDVGWAGQGNTLPVDGDSR